MSRADPLRIADYLRHILEAIDNIQAYTTGTDLAIVWQTVQNDLPALNMQVLSLN